MFDGVIFLFRYLSMSPRQLNNLMRIVAPLIAKKDNSFRKSISPEERLAVTLRFLASGDS